MYLNGSMSKWVQKPTNKCNLHYLAFELHRKLWLGWCHDQSKYTDQVCGKCACRMFVTLLHSSFIPSHMMNYRVMNSGMQLYTTILYNFPEDIIHACVMCHPSCMQRYYRVIYMYYQSVLTEKFPTLMITTQVYFIISI